MYFKYLFLHFILYNQSITKSTKETIYNYVDIFRYFNTMSFCTINDFSHKRMLTILAEARKVYYCLVKTYCFYLFFPIYAGI